MASNNKNIKIHEHFKVVPPPSSTQTSTTPLTFFDIFWLRFHPVERIFYYTLPNSQSHPSFFYQNIVPKLKTSLSLTLQHFLPLAGKIIWPSDSPKPFIQFNPNDDDGVSLLIAESDSDFNHVIENSPHEASLSHSFVPHLESTDSFASIISFQITFFPKSGFSIGLSTHHAVLDGKSSTLFIKAWAYLCNKIIETEESPILLPKLQPSFDREIIKDQNGLGDSFTSNWIEIMAKMFPNEKGNERCLKILPFQPKLDDYVRATFELTRENLSTIKQMVLSKWEIFDTNESKPQTLSSFVLTCAYSLVCLAKAIHGVENEKEKFAFAFTVDCRARLEPPIPNNYFGNCVWGNFVDTKPYDFINEDGVFLVAKSIHEKIVTINEKGPLEGTNGAFDKYMSMASEGIEIIGVAGSNRFGVYEIDFGWGRPEKVEIVSVDRGSTIGLAESKNGKGGIEVGLVLNRHAMDLFSTLFLEGLH
ncbi:phenolic glucoside malonyltransferase 1-like [Trifolium pratense]|uniref:phenolic glucoside malonyltransferase 1-like n=1 Tax=Trifolium pratense TaxID=57577 RepID=UPI001E698260|nr:phenolic glucoside malonyltransferase 1-like [Trifolium pratense]XP_045794435.1 phenolic glucoside malonyltransferase 1-like [Trifolium pratense]XP_045794436.1 phenolic glucoside malonyltransferase 1-like [Trifolium pratense]XP_045794437.1 phenolic glucoside malonyltransferase 1-like [Trifolium pratense]